MMTIVGSSTVLCVVESSLLTFAGRPENILGMSTIDSVKRNNRVLNFTGYHLMYKLISIPL